MKNSRAICLLVCHLAVVLTPRFSQAGTITIPVSGTGQIEDNKGENAFVINGSGFSFAGLSAGSNGVHCALNRQCLATTEGEAMGPWSYLGYSGVATVDISFVGDPFTISSTCVHNPDPLACSNLDPWSAGPIPASFTGSIAGNLGDLIYGSFIGTGTVDLTNGAADGSVIYFLTAGFDFDGFAVLTTAPEPNSIFLLGSGMLALLGALVRKGRAQRCR